MIEIRSVNNPDLQQQFLDLPRELYREAALWIPANGSEERELAGFGGHPVHAQTASQAWVAWRDNQPCGRIAAFDNSEFRKRHGDEIGLFGFFECCHDEGVARRLLDTAGVWLANRGRRMMRGPFQPNANYTCGVLISEFDQLPTSGMPWHPPWYRCLLETCGLRKAKDLVSLTASLDMLDDLPERVRRIAELTRDRFQIRLRHFDPSRLERDIRSYIRVFNAAIPGQWSALPISEAEIEVLAESYRQQIEPKFTALAEIAGEPVGAVFGVPDLNPLIASTVDRKLPANWHRREDLRRQICRVRLAVTVVENRFNRWGIGPLMHLFLLDKIMQDPVWMSHLREVEYSWILEDNRLSRGTLERGGARSGKVHRIYESLLNPAAGPAKPSDAS